MKEKEIIDLIKARNPMGAEKLLRYFGPLMRYVISPIVQDGQDAEECLSEVTMRVWNSIELFDPLKGTWNGWLTAIARNVAVNHIRRRKAEERSSIPEDMVSPEPTPEDAVIAQERQKELLDALSRLSTGERILFYRKYYYLQSTAQIAAELGMTARAVEGRLYRIKRRLRKMLGGEING